MDKKVSELIKASINIHGELHLDKARAEMLVEFIKTHEEHYEILAEQFNELRLLIEKVSA